MTADRIRGLFGFQRDRLLRLFEFRNPYGRISPDAWRGKIVFDIAPDVGQTPAYFLKLGARKVVVYTEKKGQSNDSRVEWNGKFYIYDILLKYTDEDLNDSVLVMDCDGYEHVIRPSNLVSVFPFWVVSIHNANLEYEKWFETLNEKGSLISNKRKTKTFTNMSAAR